MHTISITPFVDGLHRLFDTIFLMGVELEPVGRAWRNEPIDVAASVRLSGDVDADVVLGLPFTTAQRFVALFSGIEAHEQTEDDVADALGELVNMVAGNAKAHLPSPNVNSAEPVVRFECEPPAVDPECALARRCVCDCGEFFLQVAPVFRADAQHQRHIEVTLP